MERKYCITVGREFCSGGIETAKQVADALDMAYYDKEIIDKTAEMMNLNKDIIASHDEKPVSYLQSGAFQYNVMWYEGDPSLLLSPSVRIAETQFKVIQEAAKKGPAVFVGRCADFACGILTMCFMSLFVLIWKFELPAVCKSSVSALTRPKS